MKAMTWDEILTSFDPIDRELVSSPKLETVPWDDLDWYTWIHPEAPRGFAVVQLQERAVGLVFRFDKGQRASRSGSCSLCMSVDHQGGVTMMMVDSWQKPRSSLGIHVCADLNCSLKLRGLAPHQDMRETISSGQKIERFQYHMERFVRKVTQLGSD